MKMEIPSYVKPFLWSYDTEQLDKEKDKKRIITNVLNWGTKRATDWLFGVFSRDDIRESILDPIPGSWNKKSANFWSLVLDARPGRMTRSVS